MGDALEEELKDLNNRTFYQKLNASDEEFEKWLNKLGLARGQTGICVCGEISKRRKPREGRGETFQCSKRNCRKEKGVRHGTFFARSHLSYKDIFEMTWLWVHNQLTMDFGTLCLSKQDGTGVSPNTIVDWKQYFRDICVEYFQENPIVIGGPGVEVQIDETVITKRKYHRGRMPAAEKWFFGGIEVASGRAFMIPVEHRDRATLIPLIQRHIRPGSVISSDCWSSYANIGELPEGYEHRTVNHSENFIDPTTGAHTQSIESLWQKFKARHKQDYGTARTLLEQYMVEFLWRREFKADRFYHFWQQIIAAFQNGSCKPETDTAPYYQCLLNSKNMTKCCHDFGVTTLNKPQHCLDLCDGSTPIIYDTNYTLCESVQDSIMSCGIDSYFDESKLIHKSGTDTDDLEYTVYPAKTRYVIYGTVVCDDGQAVSRKQPPAEVVLMEYDPITPNDIIGRVPIIDNTFILVVPDSEDDFPDPNLELYLIFKNVCGIWRDKKCGVVLYNMNVTYTVIDNWFSSYITVPEPFKIVAKKMSGDDNYRRCWINLGLSQGCDMKQMIDEKNMIRKFEIVG